ncbi:FAD:protein FMN transferase [Fusobacterium nucleatum]|uniref:FAD:protein FMN transferase n=1 Tax=Fusobacterium nucleatum TaxID=851 RepID=UPI003CFF2FD7
MRTKNKFVVFILSLFSLFFFSCGKELEKIEESKFLFGTYIKIIVYSDNKEKAIESIEKAFNEIQRIDEKYNSKFEGSLIYNLNNSDNKTLKLDEEGIRLFEGVKKSYELSEHKYDITISPLLELWGFTDEAMELPTLKLPTKEEIEFIKTFVGFDKVKISTDGILTIDSPVKEIDTGSFLKGYAISKAKEVLKEQGIKSAFITSISSIDLIGTKPENKAWKIGLQNPDNPGDMIGIVSLKDKAMGVSGNYQTYVEINGEMYHHILDKDTGYPVTEKKMVVVLCDNAFDADLLSTTFFLMPIDKVISYVNNREDLDVLIVDKDMNIITSKNFKYEEVKK